MMERIQDAEAWILSERQLKLLLAGLGYQQLHGLLTEPALVQRADILCGLAELVRQDTVRIAEQGVQVAPALDALLQRIGDARRIVLVKTENAADSFCCYCGKPLVLCQPVEYSADLLRLTAVSETELLELLMELGAFPEEAALPELPETELLWQTTAHTLLTAEVYEDGQPVMTYQLHEAVLHMPEIVLRWNSGQQTVLPYQRMTAVEQFRQLLEGEA